MFLLMGAITEPSAPQAALPPDAVFAELRALIARHAHPDATTAIEGVLLTAADRPGEPRASTSGTVMALIVQGAKRLAVGDRVYDYGPGQYLVASVDLPVTGHYTRASADEPALGFGLILRPSAIASVVLDAVTASTPGTLRRARATSAPPGIGVADASPELLDAVVRMVRLLDSPADRDVLAPMIEREILCQRVYEHQRIVDVRANDRLLRSRLRKAKPPFSIGIQLSSENRLRKQSTEHKSFRLCLQ